MSEGMAKKIKLLPGLIIFSTMVLVIFIFIEGWLSLLKIGPVEKFLGWGYNPECCGDLRPSQKIIAQTVTNHPYFIQTNSLGLRNTDKINLLSDKLRILAIGDSMTFGPYVANEETWPAYLGEKLENKVEVLNAGVMAYSIKEEFDYLKEKGHRLNPDLVILQFFVNDISDIEKNKTRRVRESALSNYKYLYKIFNFVRDRSHLVAAVLDKTLENNIGKVASKSDGVNFEKLDEKSFGQELYDEYESIFNQLVEFTKNNHLKLAVVIIPDLSQSKEPDLTKSIKFIQDLSFENNIPVLNLQPIFHQTNRLENLYLVPWNEHLSKQGNKLVAEEVYSFLTENSILKQN